jgi:ATP phosphoribosyltransferase regulatory subunit
VSAPPTVRLPVGVRDFLPRAASVRRTLAEGLLESFVRWGYERIITPVLEYEDVLRRGLGEGRSALRFVEPATGDVVAIRPDITPQVARLVATRLADAALPLRLCYEGSVLRLQPDGRGQRELIQAGIELVGASSPAGDAEVLALAAAALGGAALTLDVGHVALVREALAGVLPETARDLVSAIAKKDVGAVHQAAKRLPKKALVMALPELAGTPKEVLARARALPISKIAARALDDVEQALELAAAFGGKARYTLDLGEVRGFAYYTGIRFAGFVDGVGDAVVNGGRYDDLVARYGRAAQATGMAVDVEALAEAAQVRGELPPGPEAGVFVVARDAARAAKVASALRARGIRTALDLGTGPTTDGGWRNLVLDGATLDGKRVPAAALESAAGGDARALVQLIRASKRSS